MKTLALETATSSIGVGIEGDGISAEFILHSPPGKGNRLIDFINALLKENSLELDNIDLLAADTGPGLYTGLRIGLSIMKGIAISTAKPLVGIPSLDIIASNFSQCGEKVAVILNAYAGEIYGKIFDPKTKQSGDYFVGAVEGFLNRINGNAVFAGTGARVYEKKIKEILGKRAIFSAEEYWAPRPLFLAKLAVKRFKQGRLPHPDKILPLYLKKSEAERRWKKFRSQP